MYASRPMAIYWNSVLFTFNIFNKCYYEKSNIIIKIINSVR